MPQQTFPICSSRRSFKVNRQDGTKFAYGVTSDMTVRWLINETFSAYAGMRVQYINAHDKYLAYGPLVGMSVRFGGSDPASRRCSATEPC